MGNSVSDDLPPGFHSPYAKPMRKRKVDLRLKILENPLNFEVLKSQILETFFVYQNANLIKCFYPFLKKFVQSYKKLKFESFLNKVVQYVLQEKSCNEQPKQQSASTTPSTADWPDQEFPIEENMEQSAKTVKTSQGSPDLLSSQNLKRMEYARKLMKFLELEISKKDNFFFELTEQFSHLFESKYRDKIKKFNESLGRYEETSEKNQKGYVQLSEQIKTSYMEAKKDLKNFQCLLQSLLLNFMTQICNDTMGEETLQFQKKDMESFSLKLIFGKNKCYSTFIELVGLSQHREEVLLKKTLTSLKNLGPEKFKIDPKFCLEDEVTPYQQIIDSLNYLNVYTNPQDKFDVISEVRKEIMKANQTYWGHESRRNGVKQMEMTADDLMSIFCYCLASSGNGRVKRHQVFIEDFLSDEAVKFGEKAYYFSTFIGAIDFFISIADDPLKKLEELE